MFQTTNQIYYDIASKSILTVGLGDQLSQAPHILRSDSPHPSVHLSVPMAKDVSQIGQSGMMNMDNVAVYGLILKISEIHAAKIIIYYLS